jgi:hypothetical protein
MRPGQRQHQGKRLAGRRTAAVRQRHPRLELLEDRCLLAVVSVDTTSDVADGNTSSIAALVTNRGADGAISLREAIFASNVTANVGGPDEIRFAISGPGPHTISPTSALPTITNPVVIDGYTQSGASANNAAPNQPFNTVLKIELAGNLSGSATGLRLGAGSGGSTIRGLAINRFSNNIWIDSAGNAVVGNFIGTNITGTVAMPGAANGVFLTGAAADINMIGGGNPADANLISGNGSNGITIVGAGSENNAIQGNRIGTDATGALDLGNGIFGVFAIQAPEQRSAETLPALAT